MSRRLMALALTASVACAASAARADYTNDFNIPASISAWTIANNSGNSGLSTVQHYEGIGSLYIAPTDHAIYDIPGLSSGGVLTVEVFDQGDYTDKLSNGASPPVYAGVTYDNGFRVGITPSTDGSTGNTDTAMILVDQRTYVSGNYYSYSTGSTTPYGGFYSPNYTGDLRTDLSATPNNGSFAADGGQWVKWQFNFDGLGNVTYYEVNATNTQVGPTLTANIAAGANSFFVYGGDDALNGGVYIDALNFVAAPTPEPASLSLLGLAVGGLFLKRRRRHV